MSKLEVLGLTPDLARQGELVEFDAVAPKVAKKETVYLASEVDQVLEAYAYDLQEALLQTDSLTQELDEKNAVIEEQAQELVVYQENNRRIEDFEQMMNQLEIGLTEVEQAKQQDLARIAQLQDSLGEANDSLQNAWDRAQELQDALNAADQRTQAAEAQIVAIEAARKELDETVAALEQDVNEVLDGLEQRLREAGLLD